MYLSVGSSKNIRIKNILGVFDLESTTVSPITRRYLSKAEKNDDVTYTNGFELPKSFVVYRVNKRTEIRTKATDGGHPTRVCISQLSPSALAKRIEGKADDIREMEEE